MSHDFTDQRGKPPKGKPPHKTPQGKKFPSLWPACPHEGFFPWWVFPLACPLGGVFPLACPTPKGKNPKIAGKNPQRAARPEGNSVS